MTASFMAAALRASGGGIAWALHFAVIYGVTALACARGMAGVVPWTIGLATLVAGAACLVLTWMGWQRRDEFEAWLSATLAALALFAIVLQAVPVLMVTPCG